MNDLLEEKTTLIAESNEFAEVMKMLDAEIVYDVDFLEDFKGWEIVKIEEEKKGTLLSDLMFNLVNPDSGEEITIHIAGFSAITQENMYIEREPDGTTHFKMHEPTFAELEALKTMCVYSHSTVQNGDNLEIVGNSIAYSNKPVAPDATDIYFINLHLYYDGRLLISDRY